MALSPQVVMAVMNILGGASKSKPDEEGNETNPLSKLTNPEQLVKEGITKEDLSVMHRFKKEAKDVIKQDINEKILQPLGTGAGMLGNIMSATSSMPGREPNVKQSTIGGALSGLGTGMAFGPLGAIAGLAIGGTTGFISGSKNLEEHLLKIEEEQSLNMSSKTIQPTTYQHGGEVYDVGIQTEKGEVILLPGVMELVDAAAKKKHKDMDKNHVTDFLPDGAIVFSNKTKFNPKTIMEKVIGHGPGHYEEGKTYAPQQIKVGDKFGKKKVTYAEAAKKLKKSIPLIGDKNKDIFDNITDEENKITRMMYLQELINSQEGVETPEQTFEGVPHFKYGGKVKKYDDGGPVGEEVSSDYYTNVMAELARLRGLNESELTKGKDDLRKAYKRGKGSLLAQAGVETLFTALQDHTNLPVVNDTSFIDGMFQQAPLSLIESQVSPIRGSVNSMAQQLLASGVDPKRVPAMLAASQGRALNAEAKMRGQFILDRINTDRGKYGAYRQNYLTNNKNIIDSKNADKEDLNSKFRNFGTIIANAIGDNRMLSATNLKAGRNLDKSFFDNQMSLFQTESDIYGNKLEFDDMMNRINERRESLRVEREKLNRDIDKRNGYFDMKPLPKTEIKPLEPPKREMPKFRFNPETGSFETVPTSMSMLPTITPSLLEGF